MKLQCDKILKWMLVASAAFIVIWIVYFYFPSGFKSDIENFDTTPATIQYIKIGDGQNLSNNKYTFNISVFSLFSVAICLCLSFSVLLFSLIICLFMYYL